MATHTIRPAAVAGTFYPEEPEMLKVQVNDFLQQAANSQSENLHTTAPKAIIAPHAGYVYSGPIAASVYARLRPWHDVIKRVILIGPAHRVPVEGLATSSADYFMTPLGKIPLDRESIGQILSLPQVSELDEAHRQEHSLEVHLPFLQEVLDDFSLVPLVFGRTKAKTIDEVLQQMWGGPETLIVVSSDLSHFHDYLEASALDRRAAQAISDLAPEDLSSEQACGQLAIRALLLAAIRHGLQPTMLDLRNSGDTAGSRDSVVGYGAFEFR
jgi:AmmeMemoRadiSam system protein B